MTLPDWQQMKWDLADDPTVSTWMRTGIRALGRGLPSEQEVNDARQLLALAEARRRACLEAGVEVFSGGTREIDQVAERTGVRETRPLGEGLVPESSYLGQARVVVVKEQGASVETVTLPGGQEVKHHRGGW
jgi:hypothetical protein